jgi:hypothetical protein
MKLTLQPFAFLNLRKTQSKVLSIERIFAKRCVLAPLIAA